MQGTKNKAFKSVHIRQVKGGMKTALPICQPQTGKDL